MFFKGISDSWDHEHARAVDDFRDALTDEIEADCHTFAIPDGCHWAEGIETVQQTGAKLDSAMQRIQQANPGALAGVFGDVQWANQERLRSRPWPHCWTPSIPSAWTRTAQTATCLVPPTSTCREFAEASGKKVGEFFTPRHVVHLLVKILDPKPGDTIADPACGSGGMLVETVTAIEDRRQDPRTLRLHGQEST